jgi:hypothetical protein
MTTKDMAVLAALGGLLVMVGGLLVEAVLGIAAGALLVVVGYAYRERWSGLASATVLVVAGFVLWITIGDLAPPVIVGVWTMAIGAVVSALASVAAWQTQRNPRHP